MSEFAWSRYDRWLTTTPEDRGHDVYCTCPECHEAHLKEGSDYVKDMAQGYRLRCCLEQMEDWNEFCRWCGKSLPSSKVCSDCGGLE